MYPNAPQQPQQPSGLPPQAPPPAGSGWGQPAQPPVQQPQSYYGQPQQPQPQQPTSLTPVPTGPSPVPPPLKPIRQLKGPFALVFNEWMKLHWRRVVLAFVGLIVLGNVIFQIVYPSSRLITGTVVDGVALGGMRKDEAAKKLNGLYDEVKLNIFFGKNGAAFRTPQLKEVGISIQNENRINELNYPFFLRFIPGSIFWAAGLQKPAGLEYAYDREKIQQYTQSQVGGDCTIPPKDASLKLVDSQLQLAPSVPGGTCDITKFQNQLASARPVSDEHDKSNEVHIESTETPAKVDDDKARELADKLNARLKDPMPMSLGSNNQQIPGRIVMNWLDFKSDIPKDSIDNSANQTAKLVYVINQKRMEEYLNANIAAKVVTKPGISKVSTKDFTETSRVNGANGRVLDLDKITASVTNYINNRNNHAVAVTHDVGPTVQYTRTYSPSTVGLSALITQFAQDNPGTYGIAVEELSSVRNLRKASYNADARFPSAGIQSLYLGYAQIINQYNGTLRPVDIIDGSRTVQPCFRDMYTAFDEKCRNGFYAKFGYNDMTKKAGDLGLANTTFAADGGTTSAADLQKVMLGLYKNQIARVEGGQQILNVGRAIRTNDGIPKGASNGIANVSHIIGESDDGKLHHDTAIIYGKKGNVALTILSRDASWEKIAALTKKIEDFKTMAIPPNTK